MPKLPTSVIIAATVILVSCLVAVVVLMTTHNDPGQIVTFITTAIIPTFVSLFVLGRVEMVNQTAKEVKQTADETHATAKIIDANVNGNLSALIDKVPGTVTPIVRPVPVPVINPPNSTGE